MQILEAHVWVEEPDGNACDVFLVKADAPVMTADASTWCASVGISKKVNAAAGPGRCGQVGAKTPV